MVISFSLTDVLKKIKSSDLKALAKIIPTYIFLLPSLIVNYMYAFNKAWLGNSFWITYFCALTLFIVYVVFFDKDAKKVKEELRLITKEVPFAIPVIFLLFMPAYLAILLYIFSH